MYDVRNITLILKEGESISKEWKFYPARLINNALKFKPTEDYSYIWKDQGTSGGDWLTIRENELQNEHLRNQVAELISFWQNVHFETWSALNEGMKK